MRKINSHHVKDQAGGLGIVVIDDKASGGANSHYQVIDVSNQNTAPDAADTVIAEIQFQNGPIPTAGVNGVHQTAICRHHHCPFSVSRTVRRAGWLTTIGLSIRLNRNVRIAQDSHCRIREAIFHNFVWL